MCLSLWSEDNGIFRTGSVTSWLTCNYGNTKVLEETASHCILQLLQIICHGMNAKLLTCISSFGHVSNICICIFWPEDCGPPTAAYKAETPHQSRRTEQVFFLQEPRKESSFPLCTHLGVCRYEASSCTDIICSYLEGEVTIYGQEGGSILENNLH